MFTTYYVGIFPIGDMELGMPVANSKAVPCYPQAVSLLALHPAETRLSGTIQLPEAHPSDQDLVVRRVT